MKVRVNVVVEIDLDPGYYPAGTTPQEMINLELDEDAASFFENCSIQSHKIVKILDSGRSAESEDDESTEIDDLEEIDEADLEFEGAEDAG